MKIPDPSQYMPRHKAASSETGSGAEGDTYFPDAFS